MIAPNFTNYVHHDVLFKIKNHNKLINHLDISMKL
jgi:hypothetical protein